MIRGGRVFGVFAQQASQGEQAVIDPGFYGADRTLQHLGNLLVLQVLAISQHQCLPLSFGQLVDAAPKRLFPFGRDGLGIGTGFPGRGWWLLLQSRDLALMRAGTASASAIQIQQNDQQGDNTAGWQCQPHAHAVDVLGK